MLRALILIAMTCLFGTAYADERAQTQQQLDATRQDITELKKALAQVQQEKSGVQKDLRSTETKMGELQKQVEALQQQLKRPKPSSSVSMMRSRSSKPPARNSSA